MDSSCLKFVSNYVAIYFNTLCPVMKDKNGSDVHNRFIILVDIDSSSQISWTSSIYSTSGEERNATNCFLLFQLISEVQRKKLKLDVDLLVSGHAPLYDSRNPFRVRAEDELKIGFSWDYSWGTSGHVIQLAWVHQWVHQEIGWVYLN